MTRRKSAADGPQQSSALPGAWAIIFPPSVAAPVGRLGDAAGPVLAAAAIAAMVFGVPGGLVELRDAGTRRLRTGAAEMAPSGTRLQGPAARFAIDRHDSHPLCAQSYGIDIPIMTASVYNYQLRTSSHNRHSDRLTCDSVRSAKACARSPTG